MRGILLDTDIAIDYLRGVPVAVDFVQRHEQDIALSAVTVAELFAGVREGEETTELDAFIRLFPVIPVDLEIAKSAGLHRRDFGPSHGSGLADGMLAATADHHALELKTLNTRHYPMFDGLRSPYVRPEKRADR
jgi:predicted nucleic acid-binding protein